MSSLWEDVHQAQIAAEQDMSEGRLWNGVYQALLAPQSVAWRSDWRVIRDTVARALAPFPDAKQAIVNVLVDYGITDALD